MTATIFDLLANVVGYFGPSGGPGGELTAITPSASGYFTAWASGIIRPLASNLNFGPGQVIDIVGYIE